MIKAISLIWNPATGWERIFRDKPNLAFVLFGYVLPLVLLAAVGEGLSLCRWRTWTAGDHGILHFSFAQIFVFETIRVILMLITVAVSTHIVWLLREPFYGSYNYAQALTVVTCSLGPLFLCQVLDGVRMLNLWIPWAIGIYFALKIFYSGIRYVAKTDPHSALGLYLISSGAMVALTGAQRYMLMLCLNGHGSSVNNVIFNIAARM